MSAQLLYLAAPYTYPDPVENTHRVCRFAHSILEHTHYTPLIPHLNLLWHTVTPMPAEFWYEIDLDYLSNCAALLRLPGASEGADGEVDFAKLYGVKVLHLYEMPFEVQTAWYRMDSWS